VPKFVADSSVSPTGLKWAAPASGGKVLQVVSATYGVETSSSSSTFADTGLTATITPSSATSKILVIVSQAGVAKLTSDTFVNLRLLRAGSSILKMGDNNGGNGGNGFNNIGTVSASYLDEPATTSATIYKTQFASQANSASVRVQAYNADTGSSISTITLLEIGA
jgi:hypothetical protein